MNIELLTVVVTALVSVATTLVAVLYGPVWKDRVDARRASQQRSDQLLMRYSEPLARAAFDLQSRLYNIARKWFMTSSGTPNEYRRFSTLWLFGQFLGWVEIVRREVQVIEYGDIRRTAELQMQLFDVADILSSDTIQDGVFRLFRAEQRAIGELMVVERSSGDLSRSDVLGYAKFVQQMENDPTFARWFEPLDGSMKAIISGGQAGVRMILIQRALIALIDFFDPDRVRFPDSNERGKLPLPAGYEDRKRLRPPSEIARFRYDADPSSIVESWAEEHGCRSASEKGGLRVTMPRRHLRLRHDLVLLRSESWVELHVVRQGQHPRSAQEDRDRLNRSGSAPALSIEEVAVLNRLLQRFDRPPLRRNQQRLAPSARR